MTSALEQPALPGVRFHVETPQPDETLPRMDIAGFCGFASRGPIGLPVPVEDVETFRDWFGSDVELALDPFSNRMAFSQLGRAVEAFFRNGGRRCWVLRVTGASVGFNEFRVPGLVASSDGLPPKLSARCAGSWCDRFRVGAFEKPLPLAAVFLSDSPAMGLTLASASADVRSGDLIRVWFSTERQMMASVESVEGKSVELSARRVVWFERAMESPTGDGFLSVPSSEGDVEELPVTLGDGSKVIRVETEADLMDRVFPGMALRMEVDGSPVSRGYILVSAVELESDDEGESSPTLDGATRYFRLTHEAFWWEASPEALVGDADPSRIRIERLRFGLRTWAEDALTGALDDLEFSAARPRFWENLPSDYQLFRMKDGEFPRFARESVESDAKGPPRFPLCQVGESTNAFVFPLGAPTRPEFSWSAGPRIPEGTSIQRSGLEAFESIVFKDPNLVLATTSTLSREANHRRFVLDRDLVGIHAFLPIEEITMIAIPDAAQASWREVEATEPIVLETPRLEETDGVVTWREAPHAESYEAQHAFDPEFTQIHWTGTQLAPSYSIETLDGRIEVTYVRVRSKSSVLAPSPWSAPLTIDHRGAGFRDCDWIALEAPHLALEVASVQEDDWVGLSWTEITSAEVYEVQQSQDPDFLSQLETQWTLGAAWEPTIHERPTYFRVRAAHGGYELLLIAIGAPSSAPTQATNLIVVEDCPSGLRFQVFDGEGRLTEFDACALIDNSVELAELTESLEAAWNVVLDGVQRYELVRLISELLNLPGAVLSPWSNTVVVDAPSQAEGRELCPPEAFDQSRLIDLHAELAKICAARGDAVALASVPMRFQAQDAREYAQALRDELGESDSYIAMYHPWLRTRLEDSDAGSSWRTLPPDGALAGVWASRVRSRGAWIAPANDRLSAVIGLEPKLELEDWERLFEEQLNLVRPAPRGFAPMSAYTLSREEFLRHISVRRLMILLRRYVLREGNQFVFEPHSPRLRERVRFQFQKALEDMYQRGAFAGSSPEEAFRVTVDESNNPQESADLGRLIIEIRVAPSRPLSFLTVRLVQEGLESLTIQEL